MLKDFQAKQLYKSLRLACFVPGLRVLLGFGDPRTSLVNTAVLASERSLICSAEVGLTDFWTLGFRACGIE